MGEWQPAFTVPELSSAAIAAARRSVPPAKEGSGPTRSAPPAPVLRKPPRGVARTLTGIEPPEVLAALGLLSGTSADEPTAGMADQATTDGSPESESVPETRQLGSLEDSDDWDKATDLIPRAPGLPQDLKPIGLRPAPTPLSTPSDPALREPPKRTTLLGFGQKPAIGKVPGSSGGTPVRSFAVTAPGPGIAPRPGPAAVKKRSEPPPPPKRLNRTLEMDVPEAALKAGGPPKRPPSRVGRPEPTPSPPAAAPRGPRSKHPPPPLKPKSLPPPPVEPVAAPASKQADAFEQVSKPSADSPTVLSAAVVAGGESKVEAALKKPLALETTEIMIREAEPPSEEAPRKPQRTLEMAAPDHSDAASKDPAPPESKKARTTTARIPRDKVEKADDSEKPKRRSETTDATSSRDARDSETELFKRKKKAGALEVPMSAVLAVSSVWVIGLVAFFFVGRVSGFKSAGKIPVANHGISEAFLLNTRIAEVVPVAVPGPSEPKPCWVTRQPSRWAASASKSVPFDLRPRDATMLLGFAIDDKKAAGMRIDPKTGKAEEIFKKETSEEVMRVSPRGGEEFHVGEKADRSFLPVDAPAPFFIVLEKNAISAATAVDATFEPLWSLEGEEPIGSEQVLPVADGYAMVFRRGNDVSFGLFGADRKAKGAIAKLESKGKNGKPRAGFNGTELAITFANKADDNDETPWKLSIARAPLGTVPSVAELELPAGGPGGDAIAPDLIGLKDGRWLAMWTEGKSGERAIRAQTYDSALEPIGDPIALSPPAGSFGQAVLGVVGTYTTVAFLQAADEGFEMWGAVLQCGS